VRNTLTSRPSAANRAVLQLPGGEAPVGLDIAREQNAYVLYLLNGAERTRVSSVQVANGELAATFPGYENTLRARIERNALDGAVTLIKAGGKEQGDSLARDARGNASLLQGCAQR